MNQTIPFMRGPGRPLGGGANHYQPSKLMWWHDAIIDEMLCHPGCTKKEIAAALNCTPTFIYMITGSDLFTARWEQRRAEHTERIGAGLVEKATRVANKSMDRILEQLEDPGKQIPLQQLESLTDKVLGRLGYGPQKAGPATTVQVSTVGPTAVQIVAPATLEELNAARDLIAQTERQLAIQAAKPSEEGLEPAGVAQRPPSFEGEVLDAHRSSDCAESSR